MPKLPDSGFDNVAAFYDQLARLVFGKALQEAQQAGLPFIPAGATVLIVGGGTGWILEQVLLHSRCRKVLYLEASEKMLALTAQKLRKQPELATKAALRLGTEQHLRPDECFDVIITNFLLDLFPAPRLLMLTSVLQKKLNPGGFWLVSDFRFAPWRQPFWQKALLQAMYVFFKITCRIKARSLANWHEALHRHGLIKIKSCLFYKEMIESAVYRKKSAGFYPKPKA